MPDHHQGIVFWLYGLSGAGKTTLALQAAARLKKIGIPPLVLDGDEFRKGVCNDLGYNEQSRLENVRRVAEISALAARQGHIVITALMTPTTETQRLAQSILGNALHFIFIKCDYQTCSIRDPKGFYNKAAQQLISNFPGKDMRFDINTANDLIIDTSTHSHEQAASSLFEYMTLAFKKNR